MVVSRKVKYLLLFFNFKGIFAILNKENLYMKYFISFTQLLNKAYREIKKKYNKY